LALVGLVFVVGPVAALLVQADWPRLPAALATPAALSALGLTLVTALVSTAACVLLGLPAALALARCPPRAATWLRAVGLAPLVLPPMVSGVALLYWLGRRGLLGRVLALGGITLPFTTAAVVVAQTFVALPFLVVSAEGALRAVGDGYARAAASLGAAPSRVFATVTWPLLAPALRGGVVLCFARALGEFGATALFAGNLPGHTQTMPLAIYTAFNGGGVGQDVAVALSVVLIAVSIALLAGSGALAPRAEGGRGARTGTARLGRGRRTRDRAGAARLGGVDGTA
jgi:molybdate transport system permease protein